MKLKRQYVEIDALKGWAIFLVILAHSIIIYPINLTENPFWAKLVSIVASVHMPLFFVVSGYCYSYRGDYGAYILKKVKRLMVPYFAFNLISAAPHALFGSLVNHSRGFGDTLVDVLFYGGTYWFLWALFVILALFPLVQKLLCRNRLTMVLTTVALFALSVFRISTEFWCLDYISQFLIWFWLGHLARSFWSFDKRLTSAGVSRLIFVLAGAAWITLCCLALARTTTEMNIKLIVEAALGVVCFVAATRFSAFNFFFERFGKYSLQLYLLNGIFLGLSRAFLCNVLHVQSGILIVSFNVLIDFFVSYLVIRYMCEKTRPLRLLMGME